MFQIFVFVKICRKLLLPSFATLPLLMAYAGHTTIVIPKPLVSYVGLKILDLGTILPFFYLVLYRAETNIQSDFA